MHGAVIALECFVTALCHALSPKSRSVLRAELLRTAELSRTLLLNSGVPDEVIDAFERTAKRQGDAMDQLQGGAVPVAKQHERGTNAMRSKDQS